MNTDGRLVYRRCRINTFYFYHRGHMNILFLFRFCLTLMLDLVMLHVIHCIVAFLLLLLFLHLLAS